MSEAVQNEYRPDYVSPPGETLLETIDALGMSQAELAERTGKAKKTINEIIKGKAPITPKIALEFERVLGAPASFWNNRERQYREALARKEEQGKLQKHVGWLKTLPVNAMVKKGWIRRFKDKIQQVLEILNFLGIASPEQWNSLLESYRQQIAFRKSETFESDPGALVAWLRKGEIEAQQIACTPFDAAKFRKALKFIRLLTVEPPEIFQPELIRLCAECGVAVVFVPELPGARVSGATRWLTPKKALIQLSLRYKTDDHLWFTFFHETAHILLHGKKNIFLERDGLSEEAEQQANEFSANMLIPETHISQLQQLNRISKEAIREFAHSIGIAPGIVVGRLQHDGFLPPSYCNDLKQRFEWVDS
jgi:addiction module HigA family antidote